MTNYISNLFSLHYYHPSIVRIAGDMIVILEARGEDRRKSRVQKQSAKAKRKAQIIEAEAGKQKAKIGNIIISNEGVDAITVV